MSVEIIDTDMGWNDILDSIVEDNELITEVGYYNEDQEGGIGVADLATIHEFGKGNVPKRPFMRRSFDSGVKDIFQNQKMLIGKMIDGGITKREVMEFVGDEFKFHIMNSVIQQDLGLIANSDITIERKGSETPLIDTKRMINATTVKIEKGN